jgi:hypothetical protein
MLQRGVDPVRTCEEITGSSDRSRGDDVQGVAGRIVAAGWILLLHAANRIERLLGDMETALRGFVITQEGPRLAQASSIRKTG